MLRSTNLPLCKEESTSEQIYYYEKKNKPAIMYKSTNLPLCKDVSTKIQKLPLCKKYKPTI